MTIEADVELLSCAAADYVRYVDERRNEMAILEAAEATDETQEFGADLDEGSAYLDLDEAPKIFRDQSVICGICKGRARLFDDGSVEAAKCMVSGSCEVDWVKKYPEKYKDEHGALTMSRLICGAGEIECTARIVLAEVDGNVEPTVTGGMCYVVDRGNNWRAERDLSIHEEKCVRPETGVEVFDGDESDQMMAKFEALQLFAYRLRLLIDERSGA